jgi:hypothetical protein
MAVALLRVIEKNRYTIPFYPTYISIYLFQYNSLQKKHGRQIKGNYENSLLKPLK